MVIGFAGQVAVVTGAGRGLGRLYALDLARRGAAVLVNDIGSAMTGGGHDTGVADAVVAEIEEFGGTALASYDPVDSPDGAAAVIERARAGFGRVEPWSATPASSAACRSTS